MSRFVKGANGAIFAHLDQYCSVREAPLANATKSRWIASLPAHKYFMRASVVRETAHFGEARKLARIELGSKTFFCTIGFDQVRGMAGAIERELSAAFLTVILAELLPRPKGTVSQIRDIVEAADLEADNSYNGHDPDLIATLYPTIRVFEIDRDPATWNVFFQLCIEECELGTSWIEAELASALRALCDLDVGRIPFRVLCRSIFDGDPSSFFLALYRCIEALYFYWDAQNVVSALKLKETWEEVAVVLEDELGWLPREESSLEKILGMAAVIDLKSALRSLGENVEQISAELIVRYAARKIYWLRNTIVHFRPAQSKIRLEKFDWNSLCLAMAGMVVHVYDGVFHGR